MSLSIPYTFIGGPGNKAKASEVNANFLAVAAKFTEGVGGISDGDISASAGIRGTKINSTPGSRIPFDRLEDGSVRTATILDGNVTTPKIADLNVTTAKIAELAVTKPKVAAGAISLDKTTIAVHTVAFGPFTVPDDGADPDAFYAVVPPSVSFPKATWELLAVYPKTLSGGTNTTAYATPNDTGTDWSAAVSIRQRGAAGSNSVSGTLAFIFISRTL